MYPGPDGFCDLWKILKSMISTILVHFKSGIRKILKSVFWTFPMFQTGHPEIPKIYDFDNLSNFPVFTKFKWVGLGRHNTMLRSTWLISSLGRSANAHAMSRSDITAAVALRLHRKPALVKIKKPRHLSRSGLFMRTRMIGTLSSYRVGKSGFPEVRNSEFPEFRDSWFLGFRNAGFPESEIPKKWISWISGFPEIRHCVMINNVYPTNDSW